MTIEKAARRLLLQLQSLYDSREAANIADWVLEHVTGQKKLDRIVHPDQPLNGQDALRLQRYTKELMEQVPVQYVLNEAWFCGMRFYVDRNVLIPRPETEELVDWIVGDIDTMSQPVIMDIGTGSGCIAVALKKALPQAVMYGVDVSESAVEVARKNAHALGADVSFFVFDVLTGEPSATFPEADIIVSNPPYIARSERGTMSARVAEHEPHLALFVDDDDPLVFYHALARLGKAKLRNNGCLYAEMHEDRAAAVSDLFKQQHYHSAEVRKDLQGKDRMIKISL